jgi:cytochrome c biogenesis protein CcdA
MKPNPISILMLSSIVILTFSIVAASNHPILIEFLYHEVCSDCPGLETYYQAYMHNSRVVDNIQQDYGSNVQIERIDWQSSEGQAKMKSYNLSVGDWNTIVVNEEVILKGGEQSVDETYLREIIDSYLALEHDIAILDVTPASRSISKGEILPINITAMNKGKQSESFNISVSLNDTSVGTLPDEFLEPNTPRTFTFYLNTNTTEIQEGYYALSIYIPPVKNEINTYDNLYHAGIVEVKAPEANSTSIRDLAVVSVIPSKSRVTNQEQINITVTLKNLGTKTENFTLEMFLNESLFEESDNIILDSDSYASKVYVLSTANLNTGDYLIKAYIKPVEGEFNSTNNEGSCTINVSRASDNSLDFTVNVSLAFIFGFFETFSPCLIILLSFLLSYTIGETTTFKDGFSQVMVFGIGFISAALLLGLVAAFVFFSVPFQNALIWIVCIFAIIFGLNTMGLDIIRIFKIKNETKPLVQKLAKKYAKTYAGITILGFIFYFLDPCIAPIFFALVPLVMDVNFTLIVLSFCLGVMVPFVGIGIVTGSISKLARNMYRHKSKIRIISGLILICYAIYLIVFHLIF